MAGKSAVDDKHVVLAVGKEPTLIARVIEGVMKSAHKEDPNVVRVDISASDETAITELATSLSPSLFGEMNVIIVSDMDSATDEVGDLILRTCEEVPEHVRLVLLHPGGVKGKKLLDTVRKSGVLEASTAELKGRDLEAALTAEFRRHNRKATAGAISALQQAIGANLSELLGAISQLCADAEEEIIDEVVVGQYYEGVADVKGWTVSDSLWNAKPVEVLEQFRWAIAQDSGASPAIIASLANGLRALIKYAGAPTGMSDGEVASMLGVPPWRIKSLRAQKAKWNPDQLAAATRLLALADRASKGTTYDVAVTGGVSLDPEQSLYSIEKNLMAIRPPRD